MKKDQNRATADVVMREIAKMHCEGVTTLRANTLAERLWPDGRYHNANGQVFHLGAAVAARLLRQCPAVREKQPRLWEILPHRAAPAGGCGSCWPDPARPAGAAPNPATVNQRNPFRDHDQIHQDPGDCCGF
jgi:hypothetical protein